MSDKMNIAGTSSISTEIETELTYLAEEIEIIKNLLAEHRNRIVSALEPEPSADNNCKMEASTLPLSPLGKGLQNLRYQLHGISSHLREVTSRVAL